MGKIFKLLVLFSALVLSSCSKSSDISSFSDKVFHGQLGGELLIQEVKGEKQLWFSGQFKAVQQPNVPKNYDEEKAKGKHFKNPRIEVKDGKKYLTADDFKYKLEVKDDNLILDAEDNNEFRFVDMNK